MLEIQAVVGADLMGGDAWSTPRLILETERLVGTSHALLRVIRSALRCSKEQGVPVMGVGIFRRGVHLKPVLLFCFSGRGVPAWSGLESGAPQDLARQVSYAPTLRFSCLEHCGEDLFVDSVAPTDQRLMAPGAELRGDQGLAVGVLHSKRNERAHAIGPP